MRGVVLYGPGDVRVEERPDPVIVEPTDAIIRVTTTCVCGSDLWPYRGVEKIDGPSPMGHEYVGIVEEVGDRVTMITPGQFVVGSFWASDDTCEICRSGYQSACVHRVLMGLIGTQAERARIPWADGTLVATPETPPANLVPSLLAFSLVHLHGGPAPVRRFLPDLIEAIWTRQIDPGRVFDLDLPLEQAAEGYRAMDERRAIKTLLRP
ncbi:alcohol dehydrogenase catalytic domain-containing protein [Streptosporangium canum]|uniref:alcohol dehydrogenase catalytic domain-containing protein n=1 Tax=Streptosporangium canum TaxID=324952 RepID=UPI003442FE17